MILNTDSSYASSCKHNYKVTSTKQSTCKKQGYKKLKCSKCKYVKKVSLNKKPHTYKCYKTKCATCTKTGVKYRKCKVCGIKSSKTIAKKGHSYKVVKTVKATTSKSGYNLKKCTVCKSSTKVITPKLKKVCVVNYKSSNLKAPLESDFGKYYSEAYSMYKNILEESTEPVEIIFDNNDDRLNFNKNFDSKVILSSSTIEIHANRYLLNREGKSRVVYSVNSSGYSRSNKIFSYAYNACKSAGITNGMSQETAVKKINKWICNNMSYLVNDGDAYVGFKTKKGQCMTYARMFEAMCEVVGIESEYVTGYVKQGYHAWNKVKIGSTWYWVDVCWNDTGSNRTEYLLSPVLWSPRIVFG